MGPKTLAKFDTGFTADAVEFCPVEGFTDIVTVGTYQLLKSENSDNSNKRVGKLFVMNVNLEGDVPELRSHRYLSDNSSILGSVNADGTTILYKFKKSDDGSDVSKISVEQIEKCNNGQENVLSLSLDWSDRCQKIAPSIAVSQSNGTILILEPQGNSGGSWTITKQWKAHDLEAWIVAYNYHNTSIIYTGADDCKFKSWDLRMDTSIPTTVSKIHAAGVCTIQSNPHSEYSLATGSYDQFVRIWDTRFLRSPVTAYKVGGGVWRLKWHPKRKDLLLSASMHAGFHVLKNNENDIGIVSSKKNLS
ncbi:Diphthine methyltransferase [Nowakowskiella sp. JEL0078]|nr:Diphthine methyltransferase [Nowakowskiella sp. JEL0078]